MKKTIAQNQFHELTRPLIGLPVSRSWRGYGSAIFLELGELTERPILNKDGSLRRISHQGQFSVMIQWSWRVEKVQSVAFGSWSTNQKITNGVKKLQDLTVLEITTTGRLPELIVQLSNGLWVHSFTTVESQTQWTLLFHEDKQQKEWISSENGKLVLTTKQPKL